MQRTTTLLAIVGAALIAATLIGITYAQVVTPTQNPTSAPSYTNSHPTSQSHTATT